MNLETEVAIVGSGPAGLSAALELAKAGVKVSVFDENDRPGGQLFKQIHKFFGSSAHGAGIRGINIGRNLLAECEAAGVDIHLNCPVYGVFPPNDLGLICNGANCRVHAEKILIATGATERALAFEGWDKPGVMGAGAFQTMMNIHHVLAGKKVVMIGSGNVGLVVAYQILQAGGHVEAIVEAASAISGYRVHADKLRRQGIPILTSHTVKRVLGQDSVEKVVITKVNDRFEPIEGSEEVIDADTVCIAVGLTPSVELLGMANVEMTNMPALGGFVPLHDENMKTSNDNIYVAGDASGIEEASSAMEEGHLAGVCIARSLGMIDEKDKNSKVAEIKERLSQLRAGKGGNVRVENNAEIVRRYMEWSNMQEKQ